MKLNGEFAMVAILIYAGLNLVYYLCKILTVNMICRHPELSNAKVKHITKMMIKRHRRK